MPLLHHQPLKALYIVYFALATAAKLPYWALRGARAARVRMLRTVLHLPLTLGLAPGRDLAQAVPDSALPAGARFVWVEGRAPEGAVRALAERAGVAPARVPGYWQRRAGHAAAWAPRAAEGEKVVYHLHGGGFWMASAHPADGTATLPRGLLAHTATVARTFALDYRLSASAPFRAAHPFPAALLDAIAGYAHLLAQGFRAENIVVAGDSAGGNLALALVRYVLENGGAGLARPGKLLLFSPWADLASSRAGPGSTLVRNRATDMFPVEAPGKETFIGLGGYAVTSYLGAMAKDEARTNIYLSPASPHLEADGKGAFAGFPPTYIVAGGGEILLDDAVVIAERINRDSGGREGLATLDVAEGAIHDFCVFPWFEPERTATLARVCKWIDE